MPQGLCGHSLVQGLPHEGLQVSKQGNCMQHQLLGWVALWEDGEGGEGLTDLEPAPIPVMAMRVPAQPQPLPVRPKREPQLNSLLLTTLLETA